MAIDNPVLYWRDSNSKKATLSLEQLIASTSKTNQVIQFEKDEKSTLEMITSYGDENTIEEPEISATQKKVINKQSAGALPEGIKISGTINVSESVMINKFRSFYNKVQLEEDNFEKGIFGFYSNVSTYFDIDPDNTIGYTMKPPTITWNSPKKIIDFEIDLLFGGTYP